MIRFRLYGPLVLLAVLTSAGMMLFAQQLSLPEPAMLPIMLDSQSAKRLLIYFASPEYPPVAKVNYLEGKVQLELTVTNNGKVAYAHVLDGNAILAVAAARAALRWVYRPITTATGPSGFITQVRVDFSLTGHNIRLTPERAERDFLREIKPPQIVSSPSGTFAKYIVHMRVLVNDLGQVVDTDAVSPDKSQAVEAALQQWSFVPARWGTLPIASYVELNIPLKP